MTDPGPHNIHQPSINSATVHYTIDITDITNDTQLIKDLMILNDNAQQRQSLNTATTGYICSTTQL